MTRSSDKMHGNYSVRVTNPLNTNIVYPSNLTSGSFKLPFTRDGLHTFRISMYVKNPTGGYVDSWFSFKKEDESRSYYCSNAIRGRKYANWTLVSTDCQFRVSQDLNTNFQVDLEVQGGTAPFLVDKVGVTRL